MSCNSTEELVEVIAGQLAFVLHYDDERPVSESILRGSSSEAILIANKVIIRLKPLQNYTANSLLKFRVLRLEILIKGIEDLTASLHVPRSPSCKQSCVCVDMILVNPNTHFKLKIISNNLILMSFK